MGKALTCGLMFFALAASLHGQNRPPSVVFRGNCENGLPRYQQWFASTQLPYGQPYVAKAQRKEQILQNYSKLKLQMPLKDVEELLGKPDFSAPQPRARLSTDPEPSKQVCSNQIAYVIEKKSENMTDMNDVAIYLFFSPDDKLSWVSPQNVPELKPFGSPAQ